MKGFFFSDVISLLRCCGFEASLFGFRSIHDFCETKVSVPESCSRLFHKGQHSIQPRFSSTYQFQICLENFQKSQEVFFLSYMEFLIFSLKTVILENFSVTSGLEQGKRRGGCGRISQNLHTKFLQI